MQVHYLRIVIPQWLFRVKNNNDNDNDDDIIKK